MEGECCSEIYRQISLLGSDWSSKQIPSWTLTSSAWWECVEKDLEIKCSSKSKDFAVAGLFKHFAHKRICSVARYKLTQSVKYVSNILRQHAMFYGNVLLRGIYGQWRVGESRKAQLVRLTSSVCFGVWRTGWASKNLKAGPWWCGQYGGHEISFTSRKLSYNHWALWRELLVCWMIFSVSHSFTDNAMKEIPAGLQFCN